MKWVRHTHKERQFYIDLVNHLEEAARWRDTAAKGSGNVRKDAKAKKVQTVSNAALDGAVITIRDAFQPDGRAFAYLPRAQTSDGITGFAT